MTNDIFEIFEILERKLESIYHNAKLGVVLDKELIPIKKELLLIMKNVKFKDLYLFLDCIKILLLLEKENKLSLVNQEFIDFIKPNNNEMYVTSILFSLTFKEDRITNDVTENIQSLLFLRNSFYGVYKILSKNYNNFNYLNKVNNVYTNLEINYFHIKDKLNIEKNVISNSYIILSSVLDIAATFIYINIKEYNYDYDILNRFMQEIIDNITDYMTYFKNERLWCIGNPFMPESLGGFSREFIVVGNLVNKFYNKENKIKKM